MQKVIPGIAMFTVVAICMFTANASRADDKDEVNAATTKFYEALNKLFTGDAGPMKDIWSHAKDVTYMGPGGGFQVGWDKVEAEWDSQAAKNSAAKSGRSNCTSPPPRRSPSSGAMRRGRTLLMARRSRSRSVRPPCFEKRMVRGK